MSTIWFCGDVHGEFGHVHDQHLRGAGFESYQEGLRGIRDSSGAIIKIGESE